MDKYKILTKLGEGAFGTVIKAVNKETEELVAIKKLKTELSWEEALEMIEIKVLRKLNNHPNIVRVIELIRKEGEVCIIFEYCDRSLLKEMD